ncbi:MAG: DNA adenine methylase [Caldilineaceae bacterium]
MTTLKAPFPWFGGKSRVADIVWKRFGDVPNYVEPFAGSLAVLLGRPSEAKTETVNDKDAFLANFWRALCNDPDGVAYWADWPVNEADLHARHWWLVNQIEHLEKMRTDPDYFDEKIAGWWVWGLCQWIGSGWCANAPDAKPSQQLPHLGDAGMGIHRPSQKLPHLGDAGMGIHRPSQKLPHLLSNKGINADRDNDLHAYLSALSERLRRVRVCCGDWQRVLGPSPTEKLGLTGVFLDPPYADTAGRDADLYAVDSLTVAHDVREWAIANGDNPMLRIALCGYEGEHTMPASWECVAWKTGGGYSSQNGNGNDNPHKERIWFSPHCLKMERLETMALFGGW